MGISPREKLHTSDVRIGDDEKAANLLNWEPKKSLGREGGRGRGEKSSF